MGVGIGPKSSSGISDFAEFVMQGWSCTRGGNGEHNTYVYMRWAHERFESGLHSLIVLI